jgi:hypothetical protein
MPVTNRSPAAADTGEANVGEKSREKMMTVWSKYRVVRFIMLSASIYLVMGGKVTAFSDWQGVYQPAQLV